MCAMCKLKNDTTAMAKSQVDENYYFIGKE